MRLLKFSINRHYVNKPGPVDQASGWTNQAANIDALIASVRDGHPFTAQFEDGYRKGSNFICSDVVAADIDEGLTIEDALKNPFVTDYAAFIYTTASHTEEQHRFRVVFQVEETITEPSDWRACLFGLAVHLGADRRSVDAARQFYGSYDAQVWRIDQVLPAKVAIDLISQGRLFEAAKKAQNRNSRTGRAATLDLSSPVQLPDGTLRSVSLLAPQTSILCPFHIDTTPSAFVVVSETGTKGVHCRACAETFWPPPAPSYDFDAFERLMMDRDKVDVAKAEEHKRTASFFESFFPPNPTVDRRAESFLAPLSYTPGLVIVKSPKGSGKTEALKGLLGSINLGQFPPSIKRADKPKRVLLIGHRKTLLREASGKLGLTYYENDMSGHAPGFAICLDSLPKLLSREEKFYDVIIIDESEQVLRHLFSKTIEERRQTEAVYDALKLVILKAKSIYALDADCGLITAHATKAFRPEDWDRNCRIVYNKPPADAVRRDLFLYGKKKALVTALIAAVKAGKRCFVTCNSKKTANSLARLIENDFLGQVRMKLITSDNTRDADTEAFLKDVSREFLKVQVVLCSPALGTGIDISFPEGKSEIDCVFGFFQAGINTHTDVDQQLARVRNPGNVSVWIDRAPYDYATDFETILHDLAVGYRIPRAVTGRSEHGVEYDPENPHLIIAAHVVCQERSSKRNFVELFVRLKQGNGWTIIPVQGQVAEDEANGAKLSRADKDLERERVEGVMNARDLDAGELRELQDANKARGLSQSERHALERATIVGSIATPLTAEIVKANKQGRLVREIETFKDVFRRGSFEVFLLSLESGRNTGRLTYGDLPRLLGQILVLAGFVDVNGVFNPNHVVDKAGLRQFSEMVDSSRTIVEEIIGAPLRADLQTNPTRALNTFLGATGLKLEKVNRRKVNGRTWFEYAITPTSWNRMLQVTGVTFSRGPASGASGEDR